MRLKPSAGCVGVRQGVRSCVQVYLMAAALLSAAGGCTQIQGDQVTNFGQSVSAVRLQTDTAFAHIAAIVQEDEIARAGKLSRLHETDVSPILSADTLARYHRAFDELESYTKNLSSLISPQRPKDFEDNVTKLGQSMSNIDPKLLPSPGVSAALTELGTLLIAAKAQSEAMKIAQSTDPAVRKVCTTMAEAISTRAAGGGIDTGLRQNVSNHWNDRKNQIEADFSSAGSTEAQKRQLVLDYISVLGQRDADLLALDSLYQSYLHLAEAHSAMARGEPMNAASALESIKNEIQSTRDLFKTYEGMKKKGANNG